MTTRKKPDMEERLRAIEEQIERYEHWLVAHNEMLAEHHF